MGDFGIVVVPRDGADTNKIINHSAVLRQYKVGACAAQSCRGPQRVPRLKDMLG